jgi:IMP dehydrogenase
MSKILEKGYSFDDVLLVPRYNSVPSRKNVSFSTKFTKNYSIDIPIVAANMDTICESRMAISLGKFGGVGVLHRFMTIREQAEEVRKVKKENLICAAAVGVKDVTDRSKALFDAGVNIFVLDIAHGHSSYAGEALKYLKKTYPKLDVMVGNIATKEAAKYFLNLGADAVKVGIGPGSMCTTRRMTGVGVPQITAIMEVYSVTKGKIPLCADGGIKLSGDIVKAISAGADSVMVGNILSGSDETPGKMVKKNGKLCKEYRGMASYWATLKRYALDGKKVNEVFNVEGERTFVFSKGSVNLIIKKLLGGIASGMTYQGADSINKIKGNGTFIEISNSGLKESLAHGLFDKI